jgi:hypothetical protein
MKSSRLEPRQHLNREQVLKTFEALGYPLENIVSAVDIEGFTGAEIFRSEALSKALQDVMSKAGDKNNRLILFRVGAERREFVGAEGENNHYVALHFIQDGPNLKLTYIDPTGAEISPQVKGLLDSNSSLVGCTIASSKTSVQFTNPVKGYGIPYQMGGNDSDCGVLVALAADMVRTNYEGRDQVRLNESSSRQLGQTLKQLTIDEKSLDEVSQVIGSILRGEVSRGKEAKDQAYNNSPMELKVLENLRAEFDTTEKQQTQVTKLINEFGNKKLEDTRVTKPHPKPKRPGQTITETVSGAKNEILDIMYLAQMLFEGGNKKVANKLRIQILQLLGEEDAVKHPENLEYLQKCLAGFRPAIYKTLKEHFVEKFSVSEEDVQCLPKPTGQQVGAKIVIKDPTNPQNPRVYYAKSHQEFCSKSDPIYGMQTSNGLGLADLKELFMYKVLEKIGYGPKTEFIVDKDVSQTGIEKGIMIVTQDSGYTKHPSVKEKSFKTFGQIRDEIATTLTEEITDETKRDIVAIDMLSRVFLLEDVMVNDGNFGMVEVSKKDSGDTKTKWKIVDFMPPKSPKGKEYLGDKKYVYTNHYGGSTIVYGFTSGNFSHTYREDSPVNKILGDRRAKELWDTTITSFEEGKSGRKIGIDIAIQESFEEVQQFLDHNKYILKLTEEDGRFKDLTTRRIHDLTAYRDCTLRNFKELFDGLKRDSARETGL